MSSEIPLINKINGFLSTVLARAVSYFIQLVSNHECSIFSSLPSVLGVNPKGGFERYVERRREAILFEGMWKTCFSSYIRRKKETRTTGRRKRYTLCKSVLSNYKTFIFAFRILYYIYTGDRILYKHMCITVIRRHYRLAGGFIASFPFFKEKHERVYVYVCLSVFLFAFWTKWWIFTNFDVGIMMLEKTPLWVSDSYSL
jgi:hypothetical protein